MTRHPRHGRVSENGSDPSQGGDLALPHKPCHRLCTLPSTWLSKPPYRKQKKAKSHLFAKGRNSFNRKALGKPFLEAWVTQALPPSSRPVLHQLPASNPSTQLQTLSPQQLTPGKPELSHCLFFINPLLFYCSCVALCQLYSIFKTQRDFTTSAALNHAIPWSIPKGSETHNCSRISGSGFQAALRGGGCCCCATSVPVKIVKKS